MTQANPAEVSPGTVVEFFEDKEVLCGVCLGNKNQRLMVLTESNRELNLARNRVLHFGGGPLDPGLHRDELVSRLKRIGRERAGLKEAVDVEELWTLLEAEEDGFDPLDLAELVFSGEVTSDHVAAVQRALLEEKLYFQFKDKQFYARSAEKVEHRRRELEREAEREALLEQGGDWLKRVWQSKPSAVPQAPDENVKEKVLSAVRSFGVFGQDSPESGVAKELLKRAGIHPQPQPVFRLMVKIGEWSEDENLYLHQQGITEDFPQPVRELAKQRAAEGDQTTRAQAPQRRDLRGLPAFTIDSRFTRDFDDALSLRELGDGLFEFGVHIADAAEFVTPGDALDKEAQGRVSSIYLPDRRIPMLPPELSEDVCSLKQGRDRLALSFLLTVDEEGRTLDSEIVESVVNVHQKLSYSGANDLLEQGDETLSTLWGFCEKFRNIRLDRGAVILPLPEVQVFVNSQGMIHLHYYPKETPSQIMVAEGMIAANGMAAAFLASRDRPSIYRSQAECQPENEPVQSDYELFHIYRQRRLFARAELSTRPDKHCSLGMDAYVSVTSPIRRYSDLVVQRQLKNTLRGEDPRYSEEDLKQLIDKLGPAQGKLAWISRKSSRYWMLKYMEQEDYEKLDALVLNRNHRFAQLLLPDFLMETRMPMPEDASFQAGELIKVKVDRINPRDDILKVHL